MNRQQRRQQLRDEKRILESNVSEPLLVRHGINPAAKKVVMEFNRSITNTVSSPQEAVSVARALLEGAQMLEPASVKGFEWPGKREITQPVTGLPVPT